MGDADFGHGLVTGPVAARPMGNIRTEQTQPVEEARARRVHAHVLDADLAAGHHGGREQRKGGARWVAGPHRLPERLAEFAGADAIVVVAGMEGALPSVVGGYVPCPVFGVPTSVGYGASMGGLSALLSMLNSCATGVAVVNIDNGFAAGFLAGLINRRTRAAGT